jgi:hypothetical protein
LAEQAKSLAELPPAPVIVASPRPQPPTTAFAIVTASTPLPSSPRRTTSIDDDDATISSQGTTNGIIDGDSKRTSVAVVAAFSNGSDNDDDNTTSTTTTNINKRKRVVAPKREATTTKSKASKSTKKKVNEVDNTEMDKEDDIPTISSSTAPTDVVSPKRITTTMTIMPTATAAVLVTDIPVVAMTVESNATMSSSTTATTETAPKPMDTAADIDATTSIKKPAKKPRTLTAIDSTAPAAPAAAPAVTTGKKIKPSAKTINKEKSTPSSTTTDEATTKENVPPSNTATATADESVIEVLKPVPVMATSPGKATATATTMPTAKPNKPLLRASSRQQSLDPIAVVPSPGHHNHNNNNNDVLSGLDVSPISGAAADRARARESIGATLHTTTGASSITTATNTNSGRAALRSIAPAGTNGWLPRSGTLHDRSLNLSSASLLSSNNGGATGLNASFASSSSSNGVVSGGTKELFRGFLTAGMGGKLKVPKIKSTTK